MNVSGSSAMAANGGGPRGRNRPGANFSPARLHVSTGYERAGQAARAGMARPAAREVSSRLRASAAHHVVDHDLGLLVGELVGLDANADRDEPARRCNQGHCTLVETIAALGFGD